MPMALPTRSPPNPADRPRSPRVRGDHPPNQEDLMADDQDRAELS
jgi:hypothetical protein